MIKDKLLVKCLFVHTMEQLETVEGREVFKWKIGHMRADYANGRWYNTVWPCHDELCTPEIAKDVGKHCDFWLRLITRNNDYNLYLSVFVKAPGNQ